MTSWKCYTVEDTTLMLYLFYRVLNFSRFALQTAACQMYPISVLQESTFRSTASPFPCNAILRHVHHRMTSIRHWTLNGQRFLTQVLLLPLSPKFQSVLLYGQLLSSYRLFSDKCTNMTWNTKRWKVPHMYLTTTHESQISIRFVLWAAACWPFRDKCTEWPKMTLDSYKCREWSQNDLNCNMLEVISKWPWTQWCQRSPLYVVSVPPSPKFQTVLPFSSYWPLRDMTPKWPWAQQSQGTPCMLYQYPRVSNFNPFRSTASN